MNLRPGRRTDPKNTAKSAHKPEAKPLTEVELELMNVIWDLGPCAIRDVQERLSRKRELAYTSVATIMKILEQKGVLESRKADRAHTYQARISRVEYETSSLQHLAKNVFHGDPSSMVMRLLNTTSLSPQELEEIRRALDQLMEKP